jgi:uracil-DNA glycosylase family 4
MAPAPPVKLIPLARQHALTTALLGVDFLPIAALPARTQESPKTHGTAGQNDRPVIVEMKLPGATPDASPRRSALEELRRRHDSTCPHCTSASYHTQTVFGEGNCEAEIMFIGEAPGEEEDRTGRPFVGRAGQKLDDIIRAMGLRREDVYIANVLKSRPPENRTPLDHEVAACAPFLAEQIRIIQPKVIVALGGPASKFLLQTNTGITRLRGQWGWYVANDVQIPVMPTFHPAYILRNYTVDTRQKVWADMQAVLARVQELRESRS